MEQDFYDGYFWQGEKIRLRPLKIDDAKKKWREWSDTETRRLLEYQLDLPPVSLVTYTEQLEPACEFKDISKTISFAIETLESEFIGWINMQRGSFTDGVFSFGISVFREYRRNGYAEEALRLILRYGFNELRHQKCNSECIDINEGSIRLHKKLGFIEEGRRRRTVYMNGDYHDTVLLGLLKEEFEENDRR
ncbi:GNAT family N-acetyltransferase [bacterium]|nr:GNAT family N-acetyltransferase [bacterium]